MQIQTPHDRRSRLMARAAASAIALALIATAAQAQPAAMTFHIPSQPLATALLQFSRQADIDVVAPADLTRGKSANAVDGAMAPQDALNRLLAGTGLKAVTGANGGLVLARADSGPFVETSTDQPTSVEEIVVTANKRPERLKDVPASVSAISGNTLTLRGAVRLEDYVASVPGLTLANVSSSNSSNQLTIRGVTTGIGGNPTVGVYIDDAPFGASTTYGSFLVPDLDPMDLARIEVLRGPQGTLYGAGSMGGLIKYVTAKPDPSRFFGRIELDGSQVDGGGSGYGVRGAVNLPINDVLAMRVSAYDRRDPGFIDDALTGQTNVNAIHYTGARASLAWTPSARWTATVSALIQHQEANSDSSVDYDDFNFTPIYGKLAHVRAPHTGDTRQTVEAFSLDVERDLGWAKLTSVTSYNHQFAHFNTDYTTIYQPFIDQIYGIPRGGANALQDIYIKKITQELRLASPSQNRLSWQVGAFYTHESTPTTSITNAYDAITGDPLPIPQLYNFDIRQTFAEFALFGDLTYRVTDRFDLTVGTRYSRNKQFQQELASGDFIGPANTTVGRSEDSSVTYLVTPRYHLDDSTMIYGRFSTGYRPGGPNLVVPGIPTSYKPDTVDNYEFGLKTDLLDRKLSVDLALYFIDWKDIQVFETNALGLGFYGNGPGAVSKGAELSVFWRPVQGLQLSWNASHANAKLTSDLPPGVVVGDKGDWLPGTPQWSTQVSGDYEFALGGPWTARLGGDLRHVGKTAGQFPAPGFPRFTHPAYDVLNLRAGLEMQDWSLTVYGDNLTNSLGHSIDNQIGSVTRITIIQPRTFKVSLSKSF